MTDLLSYFEGTPFTDSVEEWKHLYLTTVYREDDAPRLAMWAFQGEQPVAGGLAALFGTFFRWRGPRFRLFITSYGEGEAGELTWDPINLEITPETLMPIYAEGAAHLWGVLDGDTLRIDFRFGEASQHWDLSGGLVAIVHGLIGLVPQVLARLGIRTTEWTPDEALDISDPTAIENLLRAWGELNVRAHLTSDGFDEYTDALTGSIRRMLNAATIGSRFACWAATHALLSVAADGFSPNPEAAEEALIGLASVNPRSAWPSIALALLNWEREVPDAAGELLETAVEADPRVVPAWALLALLYADVGEVSRAEEACREAMRGNVADPTILFLLASSLLDHGGETDEEDAQRIREALTLLEQAEVDGLADPVVALRAMDAAEALGDTQALWTGFDRLLDYDIDGTVLWDVVEYADSYEDFTPGFEALRRTAEAKGSYVHYAALARACLRCEQFSEAAALVPLLRQHAADDYARAEAAQIALEAADPTFEERFRDIVQGLDEGLVADGGMIDLLTDAIQREPEFADGAVALAESYEGRGDLEAAIATLEAARKVLPNHLELILASVDVMWYLDDDEGAIALLRETYAAHPDDVAVIARLAEYYFEIGQDEESAQFMERAESIDPTHPEFLRVEEHIADALIDEDEFSDEDNVVDE